MGQQLPVYKTPRNFSTSCSAPGEKTKKTQLGYLGQITEVTSSATSTQFSSLPGKVSPALPWAAPANAFQPFHGEIFPHIQPEPPLVQFEVFPSFPHCSRAMGVMMPGRTSCSVSLALCTGQRPAQGHKFPTRPITGTHLGPINLIPYLGNLIPSPQRLRALPLPASHCQNPLAVKISF